MMAFAPLALAGLAFHPLPDCKPYTATPQFEKQMGYHWGVFGYQQADPTTIDSKDYHIKKEVHYEHQVVDVGMTWGTAQHIRQPFDIFQLSAFPVDDKQRVQLTQFKFEIIMKRPAHQAWAYVKQSFLFSIHNDAACGLKGDKIPFDIRNIDKIIVYEMMLNGFP